MVFLISIFLYSLFFMSWIFGVWILFKSTLPAPGRTHEKRLWIKAVALTFRSRSHMESIVIREKHHIVMSYMWFSRGLLVTIIVFDAIT